MLVEDKFIYVSLPRRGSTSFHYSCILHNLEVQTINDYNSINSKIDFTSINDSDIMNYIGHGHEPLNDLQKKFGNHYPVIAVNRDRYEVFYSLLKHIIFDLKRAGFDKIANHFSNLSSDELFFWNTYDLLSYEIRRKKLNDYLYENKLVNNPNIKTPIELVINSEEYVLNIIDILLTPASFLHNNNKDIIWFNMMDLSKMEEWVSDITQKQFKIKNVNSSKHIDCNLKLDDNFIKRYNDIYDYYDIQKSNKTLI
jgi:hypothetical protein